MADVTCPGCGLVLPESSGGVVPPRLRASPACGGLHAEVTARVLAHPAERGRWHQTALDAYAAQHVGPDTRPITVFFALNTLHLVLERGLTGPQGRAAHAHLASGHGPADWPRLDPPPSVGSVTVLDVALAEDPAGAIQEWGRSVWAAWGHAHDEVRRTTAALLGDWRPPPDA